MKLSVVQPCRSTCGVQVWSEGHVGRAGNEPSRAWLGLAWCGSVPERARLGSACPYHELAKEARLSSTLARELARLGSRAIFWYLSLDYLVN
jgi:hypothetical protein